MKHWYLEFRDSGYSPGKGYGCGCDKDCGYGESYSAGRGYGHGYGYGKGLSHGNGYGYDDGNAYNEGMEIVLPRSAAWSGYLYVERIENEYKISSDTLVKVGEHIHDEAGLHASLSLDEAKAYAPPYTIPTQVLIWGEIRVGRDRIVATDGLIVTPITLLETRDMESKYECPFCGGAITYDDVSEYWLCTTCNWIFNFGCSVDEALEHIRRVLDYRDRRLAQQKRGEEGWLNHDHIK